VVHQDHLVLVVEAPVLVDHHLAQVLVDHLVGGVEDSIFTEIINKK